MGSSLLEGRGILFIAYVKSTVIVGHVPRVKVKRKAINRRR